MSKCSLTFSGLCLIGFLSATSVLLPSMVLRTSSPVGIALSKRGLRNNMLFIEPFPAQRYHPNTNTSAGGVCGGGGGHCWLLEFFSLKIRCLGCNPTCMSFAKSTIIGSALKNQI